MQFEGWIRVARLLHIVFNRTKELCRSFETRTVHFLKSSNYKEYFSKVDEQKVFELLKVQVIEV